MHKGCTFDFHGNDSGSLLLRVISLVFCLDVCHTVLDAPMPRKYLFGSKLGRNPYSESEFKGGIIDICILFSEWFFSDDSFLMQMV